jgi:hypothetical protein
MLATVQVTHPTEYSSGTGWAVAGQGRRAVRHSAWVREDVVPGDRVRRDRRRAEGPHARCAIWLVCSMPGPPSGYPRATSIRAASRWTWCRAAGGSRGLPHGQVSGRRHGRESAVIVGEPTVGRPQPAEKADHCPGGPPSAAVQSNNQQGRCAVAESPKNLSEPVTLGARSELIVRFGRVGGVDGDRPSRRRQRHA